MEHTEKKTLTLTSEFDEIQKLEAFVDDLRQWLSLEEDLNSRVMLALNEAVTNAIIHGNKENPDKKVTVTASTSGNSLHITVEDEGEGFDPKELPNPLEKENLLNTGGRGVYLIQEYTDETNYEKGGSKLIMKFQLPDNE